MVAMLVPRARNLIDEIQADMTPNKDTSNVMKQIDENLRRVYRETEVGEVPDRFKVLLEKLRNQEAGDPDSGQSE